MDPAADWLGVKIYFEQNDITEKYDFSNEYLWYYLHVVLYNNATSRLGI